MRGQNTPMKRTSLLPGTVRLATVLAWVSGLVLALFTLRRWFFLIASMRQSSPIRQWPGRSERHVLLVVPFKDEQEDLPNLLQSLERLDYPAEALTLVLVDDGSTDDSSRQAVEWVSSGANRHYLRLPANLGKAAALNAALAAHAVGELLAVYDADERPAADALSVLCRPFADEQVGAASGRRVVSNPLAGKVAGHVALENLVHQMVTMTAKEALNLAPALLGSNCIYRRKALADVGFFQVSAILEDTEMTVRLSLAGWQIHFVPTAVSYFDAPDSVKDYWQQRLRWERGFQTVAGHNAGALLTASHLSLAMRVELLAFSLGYVDRAVLLLTAGISLLLTGVNHRPPRYLLVLLATALLTPLLQVLVALRQDRAPAALWRCAFWLPMFYLLEIAVAVLGLMPKKCLARFVRSSIMLMSHKDFPVKYPDTN